LDSGLDSDGICALAYIQRNWDQTQSNTLILRSIEEELEEQQL
jgi:hypothetical protein